jgi:two-component system, NtrC family, nitrogen regulation sensor histidine kinase NtrY
MMNFLKKHLLIVVALIFLIAAILLESGKDDKKAEIRMVIRFQKALTEKETSLESQIKKISDITSKPGFADLYLSEMAAYNQSIEKAGVGYLVYKKGKLLYWSDRALAFRDQLPGSESKNPRIVFFPNGYYFSNLLENDSFSILGFALVKYNYVHENQYLKNSFFRDFKIPDSYKITIDPDIKGYPIRDRQGHFLFTLVPEGKVVNQIQQVYLPGILYLLVLVLVLIYSRKLISRFGWGFLGKFLSTAGLLIILYTVHIRFHFPEMFSQIGFFSPAYFAISAFLPSLGDYFFLSFFLFYLSLNVFWDFRIKPRNHVSKPWKIARVVMHYLLVTIYGYLIAKLIGLLIYNSSFSFTLNQINEITVPTILGIASMMFLLFSLVLISVSFAGESQKILTGRNHFVVMATVVLIFFAVTWLVTSVSGFHTWLLVFSVSLVSLFYVSNRERRYEMSFLVLFVSLLVLFSIYVIYTITDKKEREVQKLLAITLDAEHDPAAEVFLVEIHQQIKNDPIIRNYLKYPFNNLDKYLERTYFSGFFRQYDLQITICTTADSVIIHPQDTKSPCFPFFDHLIRSQGFSIPGTDFYFMDNMDGRISYFGRITYPLKSDSAGVSVFIDLKSKIQSEGVGFPELLIDNSMRKPARYKRFDYAKYFGGELVNRHGNFPYNFYIYSYDFADNEFSYNIWDGYEHLIHKTRDNNYVIVSRSLYTFVDYLISFPYLFVVFFLSSLAALLFIRPGLMRRKMLFDLKFRIQAAIISIVFISLLLVAIGTIMYNLRESKSRLQTDLDQKMNSISEEMNLRLENETSISPGMVEWLMPELVKMSNIFQTDINIYGVNGDVVVSSRPEIFNRGLVSGKINTQAYYELYENFQTNYFQPEKIGGLSYLSAYEPIINNRGEYLGFINLPYFTHQDKYSQEISTFVVAFINLYVLLFLASILVAVFFANQITLPLVTIRENLRKIELGKRNEPINYHRDDEIGKLVREYNKKVDELAVSAELLARSERESAWREMAKQVAHEIKNPLTPMKLNIQHLQRFRGEGEAYHDYVNRICQTLINQIDTLSDIATEFSSFAQIPMAMRQVFNLSEQIGKVIELYEPDDRIRISFDKGNCGNILINADREQLSRALINLIRNGIQAIPENRKGEILISLVREDETVIIQVADNGTGISPELQEKMFSPNFTTKSSGMGLGLAIVKNIAGNFNGKVWYETRLNEGTTFCFGIPVYDEKPEA